MQLDDALDILAERLRAIEGLTVTTDPKVPVVPPMAVVTTGLIDYNETYVRGGAKTDFTVVVYVAQSDSETGLYEARGYLSGHGDTSIRAAADTPADDGLLSRVVINTGELGQSDNYLTAEFAGFLHVPGPDDV